MIGDTVKYQFVVQWPASSIQDYDAMVKIEDALIENLSPKSEVDGHDAGSGEVNIFIRTNDPKKTFKEVETILGGSDVWADVRVAYREVSKSEYTILWPKHLTKFKVA